MSPQKPGRRRGCPPWCEVNHGKPLDPVHRGVVAELHRGDGHVIITVQSDPRDQGAAVAIDAWDLAADTNAGVVMSAEEATELALIADVLGRADLGGYLRSAAALLQEPHRDA